MLKFDTKMEMFHSLGEILHWSYSNILRQFSIESCIITLLVLCVLFMLCRNMLVDDILCIPGKSKHNWKSIRILQKVNYISNYSNYTFNKLTTYKQFHRFKWIHHHHHHLASTPHSEWLGLDIAKRYPILYHCFL